MVTISFIASIFVWLLPGIYYVRKRNYNIVNPILIFPIFVVFTILVPFSEYLFEWSGKFDLPGLRSISSKIISEGGYIYLVTNFYLIISALFYFAGIYFYKLRLIPSNDDYVKLIPAKLIKVKTKFIIYLCLTPIILLPVVFSDANTTGSYFTTQLFSIINFFPALFILYNYNVFLFSFIIALPLNFLTLSKGNIFYLFLWSLISSSVIRHNFRYKKRISIILLIVGIFLSNIMISLRSAEGWESSDNNLAYALFYREYGFDTFAADVYNSYNNQKKYTSSYILADISELIPGSIYESIFNKKKVRIGNLVGFEVLNEKIAFEGVGFNRYFLTAFYHDFGFLGIIPISFLLGYIFNFWFYKNLSLYRKTSNRLFIARYLTFAINVHFLVNGLFYYFIVTFVFMNIFLSLFFHISNNYKPFKLINNFPKIDK